MNTMATCMASFHFTLLKATKTKKIMIFFKNIVSWYKLFTKGHDHDISFVV